MQTDPIRPLRTEFLNQILFLIRQARNEVLRGVRPEIIYRQKVDVDTLEGLITKALNHSLGTQGQAVLQRMIEAGFRRGVDYTSGQIEREAATLSVHEIGNLAVAIDWTKPDMDAINELSKLSFADLKGVEADVGRKVLRSIIEDDKQGLGITKISQHITEQFNSIGLPRAELIARTSINQAYNRAAFDRILRYAPFKKWIATLDGRERLSHHKMDQVIIPSQDAFEVPAFKPTPNSKKLVPGCKMMYPGDVTYKPDLAQIMNCRCTLGPKFKGPGKVA